jgi:hypothetical protein
MARWISERDVPLKFTLKYVEETSAWKLVGINVSIK